MSGEISADIWAEFEDVAQSGACPKLSRDSESTIVARPTPLERVAAWLVRGDGVLVTSLALFLVASGGWEFILATMLAALPVVWWASPLLGTRPLSRPWLVGVVCLLAWVTSLVPSALCKWFLAEGLIWETHRTISDFFRVLQECLVNGAESLFWVGPALLGMLLLARTAANKNPWIEPTRAISRTRAFVSVGLLLAVPLSLFVTSQWIDYQVRNLDWVQASNTSVPTPASGFSFEDEPTLLELSRKSQHGTPSGPRPSDQVLLETLVRVNRRISQPEFRATRADFWLFNSLTDYAKTVDEEGNPVLSDFALNVFSLAVKSDFRATHQLLDDLLCRHTGSLIASATDLAPWQAKVERLRPRSLQLVDVDRLVARRLIDNYHDVPYFERDNSSLTLLGVDCGLSLYSRFLEFEAEVFLLNYSRRRASIRFGRGDLRERLFGGPPPWSFWPEMRIKDFYGDLEPHSDRGLLVRRHRILSMMLELKVYRLEQGHYPEKLSPEMDKEFFYVCQGSEAVLELRQVEGTGFGLVGRWTFR